MRNFAEINSTKLKSLARSILGIISTRRTLDASSSTAINLSEHSYGIHHEDNHSLNIDDEFLQWQNEDDCHIEENELDVYLLYSLENNFTNSFLHQDGKFNIFKL